MGGRDDPGPDSRHCRRTNGKGKTMTELLTEWAFAAGAGAGAAIHAATGWLSGWLPWLHETVAPFAAIAIQGGEK